MSLCRYVVVVKNVVSVDYISSKFHLPLTIIAQLIEDSTLKNSNFVLDIGCMDVIYFPRILEPFFSLIYIYFKLKKYFIFSNKKE